MKRSTNRLKKNTRCTLFKSSHFELIKNERQNFSNEKVFEHLGSGRSLWSPSKLVGNKIRHPSLVNPEMEEGTVEGKRLQYVDEVIKDVR